MIKIIKLLFTLGIIFGLWFLITVFSGNGAESKNFIIKSGQGVNEISYNLSEEGLIKSKLAFETWLWLKKVEDKVVAGVYTLPADVSIRQLSNILIVGPEGSQTAITLLEGWTRQLMTDEIESSGLSSQEFMENSSSKQGWEEHYDFLVDAPNRASLEGYIFPDTYYVDASTSVDDFITKTLNNFDRKLSQELRDEINRQGKSIFEVVTLASIIEREVPVYADKKMIADVFLKRLDADIGLQSDATINYITGKGLTQPSLDDLQIDSPYNTYKYRGLPPGPISNPGIESIEAVVYPTSNEYYYFLTTKDGEVIYSVTHDEHVANKNKYLR